ncbi:helix-turn-helix domain-containing protein [Rhodococcus sp. BS-15]|uniref:helix-turn-helix domain-containing protein n=1 Tax=Rhodococcus sp. BS-15 TaxID=1304954 RepID=UPI0035B545BD
MLYVVDGPVVTSAGTAAGIDACLHLVRSAYGSDVANRIARAMVVAPHREGGQAQFAEAPVGEALDTELGPVLDRAMNSLSEDLTVGRLASWAHLSARTFVRRFAATTGTSPGKWVLAQRLLYAEQLLETTDLTIPEVASRSGIGSADNLRHQMNRHRGISPSSYRAQFGVT